MALIIKQLGEDPYGSIIESFLSRTFPANLQDKDNVLDALTSAFVATNGVRMGPQPKPEGLVEIRKRITYWMDRGEPIAVLSPWGSKKTLNDHSVDVAEVSAIRTLDALRERVHRFYAPGITVQFGIEDLGGRYLWADEGEETLRSSKLYVDDFARLVRILAPTWGTAVAESSLVPYETFATKADEFYGVLALYLLGQAGPERLTAMGWLGNGVPDAQRAFYLRQYEKLYPEMTMHARTLKLARYLAQSAARYRVGAKVQDPAWLGHYVQVNFPLPVPGMPPALGDARLHYRTLPERFARTHMPPWRAKGYLVVGNSAEDITPKLATWTEEHDYRPFKVNFSDGTETVCVEADYVLKTGWFSDSMESLGRAVEAGGGAALGVL